MATPAHHVVLIRPWVDAHGGSGCCAGDTRDALALDAPVCRSGEQPHAIRVVARAYTQLCEELPEVDVQIVSAGNTAYLLPTVLRSAYRRDGLRGALRRANQATRPGALLVDGTYVGDVVELGPDAVVETVRSMLAAADG